MRALPRETDEAPCAPATQETRGRSHDVLPLVLPTASAELPQCLGAVDARGYDAFLGQLAAGMIASATPEDDWLLFPGPAVTLPNDRITFARGAAGVLWSLARAGAAVPDDLTDWLETATEEQLLRPGPGLADGLSGLALALSQLGRDDAAERMWDAVLGTDLDSLDGTVAAGIPGIGLALLERDPADDGVTEDVRRLARALAGRIERGVHRLWGAPGVSQGGLGAALFLMRVHELTEDARLEAPIKRSLRRDLARPTHVQSPGEAPAWLTAGAAMVLHQAVRRFGDPWLAAARDQVLGCIGNALRARPGLMQGGASLILGLQQASAPASEEAEDRYRRVSEHLSYRFERVTDAQTRQATDGMSFGLAGGLSNTLLALRLLRHPGVRTPFFL